MPPTRLENAPGLDEAPAATPAPAMSGPASAGFKSWLPLVVTVAVMPVLAYAMTQFVLVPRLQKGLGATVAAAAENGGTTTATAAAARKETVPMNKLLVNVAGTMGSRYLLVSLALAGGEADFKGKIQDAEPQLRDMACGVLATKTIADLEKPGARNLIRSELLSGFNNILGGPVVQDIYLTEFAIQ